MGDPPPVEFHLDRAHPALTGEGLAKRHCDGRKRLLFNYLEKQNMKGNDYSDLGMFEGFNFRAQSAIDSVLSADEVLAWDHDAQGEAEFWPDGSNPFVSKLLPGTSCSAQEIREVIRIFCFGSAER